MSKPLERSPYEELARSFEANAVFGHIHSYDLYRNWLEAVWAFLEGPNNPEGYKECLDRYTFEQGGEFGRLLGVYTTAVEQEPFRDILGELFMRLDVKSAQAGQYFSPFPIAEMMARIQFSREDFERHVQEKGEVSVCDPAVGSGVMLLAFAKVVDAEFGRWGVNRLRLCGQDIDKRCVLMCKIQLRMNGLDTFGRMAGVFGNASANLRREESATEIAPATLLPKTGETSKQGDRSGGKETPDLDEAIILQTGDITREASLMEQMTLF